MGARMGGLGARVGARPPPPLWKKNYFVAFLLLVLHGWASLQRLSPYGGPFHHVETFGYFFSMWGAFFVFLGMPLPAYGNFCGRP